MTRKTITIARNQSASGTGLVASKQNETTRYTFTANTPIAAVHPMIFNVSRLVNCPMIAGALVSINTGSSANGNCTLCKMFSHSPNSSPRSGEWAVARATATAGPSATDLVIIVLNHGATCICRNPCMTNCPAYVPVIVDACPDASNPNPQMYFAASPRNCFKASPAELKPISAQTPCPPKRDAHDDGVCVGSKTFPSGMPARESRHA
mmetsp:Transcript_19605/g.39742  ORF Transcript_19605/g.39742 Transcript_19605/m.39742 type:complete len:208 (-) Transcript_19605:1117-1740(-)